MIRTFVVLARRLTGWGVLAPALALAGHANLVDATVLDKAYPPEQVRVALAGSLRPLGACFSSLDGGQAGRGEVAFQVSSAGRAASVAVSGDLDGRCVEREASQWRFPSPERETPQVFVTLEYGADPVESATPAAREREEFEDLCSLVRQLRPRAVSPEELPRKALRTLLGSGLSPAGQRWATALLQVPPFAQLPAFQAAAAARDVRIECPEYVGWHEHFFGRDARAPLEVVLYAAGPTSLKALVRNRSATEQRLEAVNPVRLVDATGREVAFERTAGQGRGTVLAPQTTRVLGDEAFCATPSGYAFTWGEQRFFRLASGTYRARVRLNGVDSNEVALSLP